MHFSRPSGWRLSWWRPWKRGAVGFLYSGYCSVSRFLNMALKVTPKPATGPRNSGIVGLLLVVGGADELAFRTRTATRHRRQGLPRQRRHGETARQRVELLWWRVLLGRRPFLALAIVE